MARFRALLVGDKVVVPSIEDSRALYSMGFYGKPIGVDKVRDPSSISSPLVLDAYEAVYLAETGAIEVAGPDGRALDAAELRRRLGVAEGPGPYEVYRDLRSSGLVVRSGLKYGAAFLAYRRGPGLEHAPFIVHYVDPREKIDPVELVMAGRVGHSVRKTFVMATIDEGAGRPVYLMLKWFKP